jgi:hypothetical protein
MIFMILAIVPVIILGLLIFLFTINKRHISNTERKIMIFLIALCFLFHMFSSIRFGLLYMSPHNLWKNSSEAILTKQLMNCARAHITDIPRENWNEIETCMNQIEHYHISKGRTPYLHHIPIAFVFTMDTESVFTTPYYDRMSYVDKALVMIHECSHLFIGTVDHAYVWQKKYLRLSGVQHLHNADSYASAVAAHCTNSSYTM